MERYGVEHRQMGFDRGGINPIHDCIPIARLVRILNAESHDTLVVYSIKLMIYLGLARRLLWLRGGQLVGFVPGLGFAFNLHNSSGIGHRMLVKLARLAARYAIPRFDRIVFTNTDNMETLRALGALSANAMITVVPGAGVNTQKFAYSLPPKIDGKVIFGFVGRLSAEKGFEDLLAAARILQQRLPGSFVIRAAGFHDTSVRGCVSSASVESAINDGLLEYLGRIDNISDFLQNIHVGVLPSYHEGRPTAVMEWMSTGRAGITTTAPGCRETIIDSETGYLVPVGNKAALVEAMHAFVEDPAKITEFGINARRQAERQFALEKALSATIDGFGLDRY